MQKLFDNFKKSKTRNIESNFHRERLREGKFTSNYQKTAIEWARLQLLKTPIENG